MKRESSKINIIIILLISISGIIYYNTCLAKSYYYKDKRPDYLPQRIVSLAPNITEILFALGTGDRLAAVTDFCNYPPDAKTKISVGGLINPSIERILGVKADLVISTIEGKAPLYNKLIECDIPVLIVVSKSFNEIFDSISDISEAVGRKEQAKEVIREMNNDINDVKSHLRNITSRPSVLFLVNNNPIMAVGRDTFANDLILLAGGENISGNSQLQYPNYSLEEIIIKGPEIIIMATMGSDQITKETITWWSRWEIIPAVKNGNIFVIDGDLIHRPSPRITKGLKIIAQCIHSELF